LHPQGSALLDAGQEVDGGADPQRESTNDASLLQLLRNDLLLRRADLQESKSEWTDGFDLA